MVEPARRSLGNRYELSALLAAGGMGQVWRAHDQLLDRPVAVKVLRSEYTGDPLFVARFRAEAQHAAALSHPNIAAVYDYGEERAIDGSGEHLAYLVMELVEGESLSAVLARDGALTPERTLAVLRQTAAALAAAHAAGVIHRDVKPGNVLVPRDGTVKITDFGIAWSAGSVPLTQTGQVLGTASYLSPEQAAGAHATPASDVYSLGMVGYECLAGRRAFDGENSVTIALRHLRDQPDPLPPEVPDGLRTLIERALVKDPAQRYPDGAAFVAAIDDLRAGRALTPVQHTDTQSFWLLPAGPAVAGASAAGTPDPPVPAARRADGRLGRVLVPLIALLVGAGLAALVLQALTPSGQETTAAATEVTGTATGTPEELVLAREDYVGRPVGAVQAQLESMGLLVQLEEVATDIVDPDLVVDVAPLSVRLQPGQAVLLSYAVAPDRSAGRNGGRNGGGQPSPADAVVQPSDARTPTSSAVPTPTGTPTPTASPTATPSAGGGGDSDPTGDDTGNGTGDGSGGGSGDGSGDGDPAGVGDPDSTTTPTGSATPTATPTTPSPDPTAEG